MNEAVQNLPPGTRSPYIICRNYQHLATAIAKSVHGPPTTRVSDDEDAVTFREKTLHIPAWRAALAKLLAQAEEELDALCYGDELGLVVPRDVPDDWSDESRGYSWTNNDPDRFGLKNGKPLLYRMLQDPGLELGQVVDGKLRLNVFAIQSILQRCDSICEKLFLLVFFTVSQAPRISEIGDYKHTNSTRGRNMFNHDGAVWFLNRRVKYETLLRRESSIASKACQQVTALLQRFFLLVRPLEKELVHHMPLEPVEQRKAYQLYSEYMWVQSGEKMTAKDLRKSISSFLHTECGVEIGPRSYRQICVEIGRVFLGSEVEMEAEELDLLAVQMGHSLQMARSHYASEVGRRPGMSSDLLLRYGRISEMWWEVLGLKSGAPPLEPLRLRRRLAAQAAVEHQQQVKDLLTLISSLKKEITSLKAPHRSEP
jgi:hypothetical protein